MGTNLFRFGLGLSYDRYSNLGISVVLNYEPFNAQTKVISMFYQTSFFDDLNMTVLGLSMCLE